MEPTGATSHSGTKNKGQLDFHKAMQDFKNMFPGMDADVIEAVLRANDGLVDVTVDQLISMASADGVDVTDTPRASNRPSAASRWKPPMLSPLPDDFLRLEPAQTPQACSPGRLNSAGLQQRLEENRRQREALGAEPPPDVAQYLEDERVALMLQNDEFMDELRRNREFMDALDIDTPQVDGFSWHDEYESMDEPVEKGAAHHKYPDDEAFKERLKHMGKASRKKFAQLARLFHFNRRGGARAMLGHGPVPSGDRLLLSDDQLLPEDLDDEPPAEPKPQFEDRHSVETSSRGDGDRSPRRGHHQMV